MSATNYTPISLYYSTTAAAVPLAANLVNGELAINITDGKIYYKDNAGVVQLFGSKSDLTTISFGTTGLTPSTATGGAVTVAGTLITSNGGTGLSSYTAGDLVYYASGTALSKLAIGTANYVLTSSGSAPQYVDQSTLSVGSATNATGTGTAVNTTAAQTLTNKRIDPRVSSTTSSSSITPDIASYDQYCLTAQAATLTINAPTGTPVDGNKLIFRITDNGTAQTLSWNATYTVVGATLPTATVANKTIYVGCLYNAALTRWDVISAVVQA